MKRSKVVAAALLAAGLVAGCGGDKPGAPDDTEKAELFASSLDDRRTYPDTFAKCFATGAVPPKSELSRYGKVMFEVAGPPTVRGGEAVVTMKISSLKGHELGRKEWVLVKEGAEWKVKSAPLP